MKLLNKINLINCGWILIGLTAITLKLLFIYYTYWHKHFLVPPGFDATVHFQQIEAIINTGKLHFSIYPPGFYLIVIIINKISQLDIFSILTTLTPVLMILPTLAIFFLLRQIFSIKVSVISAIILLLTSNYPVYAFVDGNYPDILAYGVFAVLLFTFMIKYLNNGKIINLIASIILLFLIALTHHFTFFNVFGIIIIFTIWFTIKYFLMPQNRQGKKYLLGASIYLIVIGTSLLLANFLYGNTLIIGIKSLFISSGGNQFLRQVLNYSDYPVLSGNLIWYFGIAGFIYLISSSFKGNKEDNVKQLIIIWFLFYYIFSRFSSYGVPGRFSRELALPLVISMAYLLRAIFENNHLSYRLGRLLAYGLIGYLIIINSALYTNLDQLPDPYTNYVSYFPIDEQKVDYLAANIPEQTPILYNPNANLYFPIITKNNILALGLSANQENIVESYINNPKNQTISREYQNLILDLKHKYKNISYIIDDVKPPGNTNEAVYFHYAGYTQKKKVLEDMAKGSEAIKTFEDSTTIYKLN